VPSHLTRKELKQDNVALRVGETFGFLNTHRTQTIQIVGAVLVLALIIGGTLFYRSSRQESRQLALGDAIALQNAPVGTAPPNGGPSFPSETAKRDAVYKAYEKLSSEYSGSNEGYIAEYTLAGMDVDAGKLADARKKYQDVADHADKNYASLGKLALAQLDFAENKSSDAQALLKDLMEHPTDLVSKNQATFALAKGIANTQPEEARKLLLPLAGSNTDISQVAVAALGELPQK
jgi:predicted negative regulator of RcsB-dependent stress response